MAIFNDNNYSVATSIAADDDLLGDVASVTKAVPAGLLLGAYVIEHGGDDTVSRPDIDGGVLWVGTVEPSNWESGDVYYDIS